MEKKVLFLKARTGMDDPSPPMAFSYLGKVAKDNGFKVLVENLNAQYSNKTNEDIVNLIKKEKPLIVGIHIFTNCAQASYKLVDDIRPFCKTIVAGGPHPTICPEEVLGKGVDIVAIGEAEISFKNLLDALLSKKSLKSVDGIAYKEKGKIVKTKPQINVSDLDEVAALDKNVHRTSDYVRTKKEINNFGQILSTRGCPGQCTFCYMLFDKCFRYMSAEKVYQDILDLKRDYGVTFINFIDDAFTINRKRLIDLCDLMIERKLNMGWSCCTRVDFLNKELVEKMGLAGCKMITFGIESCIPNTLRRMKKTGNPEWYVKQASDLLKWCYEANIRVGVNILTGFPWESAQDMRDMQKYIDKIKPYVTQGFYGGIIQPQPKTAIYEEYAKEYEFKDWWLHKDSLFTGEYRPFFMTYYHPYWDHLQNNFFKLDKEVFKEIDKLYRQMGKWNLYIIARRRFRNPVVAYSMYQGNFIMSNLSIFLYDKAPKIEKQLMEKVKKFSYRFKFRKEVEVKDL